VFGWLKNKDREKNVGKGRGECEGSRIFYGIEGRDFWVFF